MTTTAGGADRHVDPTLITARAGFGEALTELRARAGLSIRAVAKLTEIPVSTLSGYYSGRHVPSVDEADNITKILKACSVTDSDRIDQWQEALTRVRRPPGRRSSDGSAPYRGLKSFEPEDADWFFGRQKLTDALVEMAVERHHRGGLIVVVGSSGSGKSSLLRAGLIVKLGRGKVEVPDSEGWRCLLFTPGQQPLRELASRLAAMTETAPQVVYEALRADPVCCSDLARQVCGLNGDRESPECEDPGHRLVLVVDQFEEVFAPGVDTTERAAFIAALDAAGNQNQVSSSVGTRPPAALVVLGLRADFYPHASRSSILRTVLQNGQLVVGPMNEDELREAITQPARRAGGEIDEGLVELLLRDLQPVTSQSPHDSAGGEDDRAHEAGALPFLSHALLATWEVGNRNGRMTVADYQKVGGIRGAIKQTADEVYQQLTDAQRETARLLFLRLVHVATDTPDTLRRVAHAELVDGEHGARSDEFSAVLDQFVDRRLITVDRDRVEISHHSLLIAWPRLRGWLDSDRVGLATHRQLNEAARHWREANRDPADLYRGGRLAVVREWADDPAHQGDLTEFERDYLKASIDAEHRRVRRRHRVLAVMTVLVLLAGTLAGYALLQRSMALEQRDLAISHKVAADAARLRGSDPALAAQLSLIAYKLAPTAEARSSLLDTYSGPSATRVLASTGFPQTVAFSPDSSLMATGGADSADTAIRVWSLADRLHPRLMSGPLVGHTGPIYGLAFSPDGRILVSSGADQAIRVWDLSDPTASRPLGGPVPGPADTVFAVAFSPDGRILAAGGADDTVRLYDITTPHQLRPLGAPLTGPAGNVQTVAFNPTGGVLAAGSADGTLRLWNLADPTAPIPLDTSLTDLGSVLHVAFSADGQTLAAGGGQKTVRLWNVSDPAALRPLGEPLTGPASLVNSVAFSGDGRTVAAASSDNKVWVWELATRETIATLPHPGPATMVRFLDDDEGTALASSAVDGAVRIWSPPGPVITEPTDSVFTAEISSDGQRLIVGWSGSTARESSDQRVRLYNITDPRQPAPLGPPLAAPAGKGLGGAAGLSPDGRIVAAGTLDGAVYLWDVSDPAQPVLLDIPLAAATDVIESVEFSPDGKTLVVAGDDTNVRLWDVTDPRQPAPLATLHEPEGFVFATAFSGSGRLLAAASADKKVWLWDIDNREQPFLITEPLTGPTNEVYSVAFSGDDRTVAAGSVDKTVRLWDITDPRQPTPLGKRPLIGPNSTILWLTFSPDTNLLATGAGDGTVWLWDLSDRHRPSAHATLTALPGAVWSVSFSPDGHTLAAGGGDTTARLWETDPDVVAEYICSVTGDPITATEWTQHLPELPYDPPCPS